MFARPTPLAKFSLFAAVCFAPFLTGCRATPSLADDGSAARLVAAVRSAERADSLRDGPALRRAHPLAAAHRLLAAAD